MKPEIYQDQLTFRVFDPRAIVVITGSVDDPIVPKSSHVGPIEFTEEDVRRVKELRKWWREAARRRTNTVDTDGFSQVRAVSR